MEVLSGREHAMAVYTGTSGNDTFVGTSLDDLFKLGSGGNDSAQGLGGDDIFDMKHAYNTSDSLDGGAGFDVINLKGDYDGSDVGFAFVQNVEEVVVAKGHSYHFDIVQSAVDAGGVFVIDGSALGPEDQLFVHNTFITETSLKLRGGSGDDALAGGAAGDVIYGGLGSDHLTGDDTQTVQNSRDRFVYKDIDESTNSAPDVVSWNPTHGDRIDLRHIDADVTQPGNQAFDFIGTAAFSHSAGELRYESDASGFLVSGDVNGDGLPDFSIETGDNLQPLPGTLIATYFML